MSTHTENHRSRAESGRRHSAFDEFSRDERRPAVMLLGALIIAAIFFAIGIFVGRLTNTGNVVITPQSKIETPVKLSPTPLPQ